MNKPKKIIQGILVIGVMLVGVHMLCTFDWPTPPAISGLGFLMAGFAMWIPRCPIMKKIFGGKGACEGKASCCGKKCGNNETSNETVV